MTSIDPDKLEEIIHSMAVAWVQLHRVKEEIETGLAILYDTVEHIRGEVESALDTIGGTES